MFGNSWFKKERPLLGMTGFGGGADGKLVSGGAGGSGITASGGIQSPTGAALEPGDGYAYHFFQGPPSGNFVISALAGSGVAEVVCVGGGGGSGGAGGGAGSVVHLEVTFPGAATYPISIGPGGDGGQDGPLVNQGTQGTPSFIGPPTSKVVEAGGGGQAGISDGSGPPTWKAAGAGLLGGSGGGQSATTDQGSAPGPAGPTAAPYPGVQDAFSPSGGYGHAGGSAHAYAASNSLQGGGGGAGAAGANAEPPSISAPRTSGVGGSGVPISWIPAGGDTVPGTLEWAKDMPDNLLDTGDYARYKDSAPLTWDPFPGSAGPWTPPTAHGAGANGFKVARVSDGSRVKWTHTGASNCYLWTSEDGKNWRNQGNPGSLPASVESKYIGWAGGPNDATMTFTAVTAYGTSGPGPGRYFGGGGGGGTWGNTGGEGGAGGGAEGGMAPGPNGRVNSTEGLANTGGGAGGCGYPTWGTEAKGGSGFIAIRYTL